MRPLLPFVTQLLPLLAFLVVDAFVTDVRVSIAVAVVFAVGQLAVTWARWRRFDWFVVLDVALIAVLGGVSIALEDELFFKLKPAIVEAVSLGLLCALLLAPARFLTAYYARLLPDVALDDGAVRSLKRLLAWMGACVAGHVALVLYAALETSRETWAFVSGPGFYLCLLPVALHVLWVRRQAGRVEGDAA